MEFRGALAAEVFYSHNDGVETEEEDHPSKPPTQENEKQRDKKQPKPDKQRSRDAPLALRRRAKPVGVAALFGLCSIFNHDYFNCASLEEGLARP